MSDKLPLYYRMRREVEIGLAEAAASPEIARIHHELAARYSQLVQAPTGSGVTEPDAR